MAYMSVEEWRKKKEAGGTEGTKKSSPGPTVSVSNDSSVKSSKFMSVAEWRAERAKKSAQGWSEAARGLLDETQRYYSKWNSKDDDLHTSLYDRTTELLAQADSWRKSYAGNDEAISGIDSVVKALSDSRKYAQKYRDFYSQWDTEDEYKDYVAKQKDYEEKSKFDIEAAQKEIEELERKREEMAKAGRQPTTQYLNAGSSLASTPYAAVAQGKNVYDNDIAELDKVISQKKQYLNQAKHIQDGITLAGAVDNADFKDQSGYVSTQSDSRWGKLTSDYGLGYDDLTYEYINNQDGIRDEIKQKHRTYDKNDSESVYEEKGYDYLTENEVAIYNYYYAKEGKDKAQEYLDSIQESLNLRKATGMYENMEENTLLELAFGVAAGLDQFDSGVKNLFNTEDDYIPQTATQMASGMVREDLADVGPNLPSWLGGGSLGQMGYDAVTTTANMAPSIMTSMAANILAPGSGAIVGNAMMFASSAGNAYQEALNLGYDKDQARAYATLVGGSEAGLQYLLGGIGSLGGKVSGNALAKILNGVDNAFARTAIKLGGNMLSEGIEEGLQEILTPWFQNLTLYTDEDINWSEVAYSTLLGALTAGFMEGGSTIYGEVNTYKTGKQLQEADVSAQRLSEIGKTFAADTVAYQLAGRVNENTGAYTIGRLFNEIGATLTEQNVNDITQALVAKGMTEDMARANAKAMASVVEGGNLTDAQVKIIEANELLAEAVRTTIIDSNATWFQRTKGYNDALMALAKEKASTNTSRTEQSPPGQENTDASDKVDTQEETGSEVDTVPMKVKGISSIKDGQVTIKLEDDSEVNIKDADLDPDDGVRIETIASINGISAADADFVLNALRASTNASAQMDALGAKEAYKYGFYGLSQEHMTKYGVFANSLTDTQRNAIYEKGRNARQQQIEKTTPKKAEGSGKQTGVYFDTGNGNFVPYSESNMTVDKKRSAGVQAAMVLHKLGIGGDIYFFNSYVNDNGSRVYKDKNGVERPAPNGWYSKDGSIYIDLNAGNKGEGYVLFTLAHELTHFIEQWSPQKYKILADFLVENYEKGQSMDKLVRAKQDKLSDNRGKKVSYKEAYSEVVADSMEAMLADGNVLEKLIELKSKDNALFTKMKQFFDNLLKKIRSVYKDLTPDSDEGKAVLEMTDSIEKIQQLFADALVEASENYQMAEKNTTHEGGEAKYSQRYLAADTNSEILSMVSKVSNGEFKANEKVYLGIVADAVAEQIYDLTGINVNGFKVAIEARQIDHILKDHGIDGAADHSMSDPNDIARMEYALANPDDIRNAGKTQAYTYMRNGRNRTADTVLYEKEIGEKSYYVVQAVPDTKAKTLYIVTAFIGQKGYKKEASQLINAKGPDATAQTGSVNASKDIVRNNSEKVNSGSVESMDITMDEKTESVAPAVLMSERTWTESDYVQERENAAKEIAKAIGVSEKKAKAYIDSVNSIAKMIADDRVRLDYFSSPGRSFFVSNVEYGGSFDFSTLCKKRRLLTGTFTAIQKALPNTALTANEILDIRNRMKKADLEVSCGLCYVEGSRANMGQFAKEFLKLYKQYYPDAWQPNMADVNTPDGIEWVRINHPECYEQYEYFWNHYGTLKPGDKNLFASQQKPKLYQLHTEYKGEILDKFNDDDNVEEKNLNGGIRLQSFSDFEIVHLIDTMQIIMDMSRVGLAGQAYTKVPDFAWALGDTGLKINLSLIAKGVDANGKLIFDDVEGMPIDTAVKLRNRYSKNVGTILVAFNDEQLLAAMADERVDFIIPFHRSQWKKSQYEAMGLPAKTKDYTYMQNEKFIKPQYHEYRGRMVKDKATNYMPNEYWDFSKSGKENAEAYLEMCARNNKRPKFYKLLQNNGDGSYSLKADGSTDGYWKLLIDFKMYDNDGMGSPQMPVKPDFNMEEATRMLDDYKGGHSNFPVAQGIVDDFVKEYKESHKDVQYSDRNTESVSNRSLLANALESVAKNDMERKKIQEYKEKIGLINAEERKLSELNKQINELSFAKGPKDTKKVRDLQSEARQTANRINIYDSQLLRLEASKPLQDVLTREKKMAFDRGVQRGRDALEAYRTRAEKQQQEIIERYQESRKRGVENRQKAEMRKKIRRAIMDLDKILNRGNKKRNVKEDMKDFVADALETANILFTDNYSNEDMVRNGVVTELTPEEAKLMNEARAIMEEIANLPAGYEGWQARQEQEAKLNGRLSYRMMKLRDVFVRERARLNKTQVSEVLGNLADSYARLQNSEYAHIQGAYHEAVHEYLKMLQDDVGGTIVKDMTLGQLEELYKAYTMVKTTVHNANRMFAENLNNTRDALANRVMFEVHEAGGEHGLWSKAGDKLNSFSWNNEKPVYAFERIGSNTLKTLYGNIRKGQDGWAVDIQEANNFRMELYKKYKRSSWDTLKQYKFTSSSGIDFELNLDQIMSLYAYSKRAQAHDHLLKGGFVFDGNTEVVVTKNGIKRTYLNKTATAYNLSFEILEQIISELTPEQKAFVDEMQDYLSTTMGEKGNEVSMELYGVKLFNEKFYFPLRSAGQYMERAKEADMKKEQGQINIANAGFSKAVKIHASNPVVLSGFMDVWAGHVNEMSMYHSFVLPMEDFRRVYNYSSPHMEGEQSASVNGVIQNAYGAAATDYIDQLYRDLNGGAITDPRENLARKLTGNFKKAAVFGSLSVVLQQPSAIGRALAFVDPKYFGMLPIVKGTGRAIANRINKKHEAIWSELKQYAPVAFIKEMGYFDTGMGRSAKDFLTSEESHGFDKVKNFFSLHDSSYRDEIIGRIPAVADELTWIEIWEAVKRETKEKKPGMNVKSEEFLKLAGERFSEVIDKTQVYDSVLARSANMRSKTLFMNIWTSFMAEPTTSINMIEDALRKGKKGNKKYAARMFGAVFASVLINSALVSVIYAARDDDEDETYIEKYLSSFTAEMLDGINPLTYYPFLKDVWSVLQGFDVERADMSLITDLVDTLQQIVKAYAQDTYGMDKEELADHKKKIIEAWLSALDSVASLCGVPVKNIRRDLNAAVNMYQTLKTDFGGRATTFGSTKTNVVEAVKNNIPVIGWLPDDNKADKLYKAVLSGDNVYADRLKSGYKDEKAVESAMRSAIKKSYLKGNIDIATAQKHLVLYGGQDGGEARWQTEEWNYEAETGDDFDRYDKFYEAIQTGKNLKAVIKEYNEMDVDSETLSSQITKHYKDDYIKMSTSEKANIKGYLLNAIVALGYTREEAEKRISYWEFESKYGFDYSKRKEAYLDGEVSKTDLRRHMLEFGGMEENDADNTIRAYDWMKIHPDESWSVNEVIAYTKTIEKLGYSVEDSGIDPETFAWYKAEIGKYNDIDLDGDGKADPKLAKMQFIDSLPITNEQKDVLYFANGWAESKLKYAPWH